MKIDLRICRMGQVREVLFCVTCLICFVPGMSFICAILRVKHQGFVRVMGGTHFAQHMDVVIGNNVQFGNGCNVASNVHFGNNVLMAGNVQFWVGMTIASLRRV